MRARPSMRAGPNIGEGLTLATIGDDRLLDTAYVGGERVPDTAENWALSTSAPSSPEPTTRWLDPRCTVSST